MSVIKGHWSRSNLQSFLIFFFQFGFSRWINIWIQKCTWSKRFTKTFILGQENSFWDCSRPSEQNGKCCYLHPSFYLIKRSQNSIDVIKDTFLCLYIFQELLKNKGTKKDYSIITFLNLFFWISPRKIDILSEFMERIL